MTKNKFLLFLFLLGFIFVLLPTTAFAYNINDYADMHGGFGDGGQDGYTENYGAEGMVSTTYEITTWNLADGTVVKYNSHYSKHSYSVYYTDGTKKEDIKGGIDALVAADKEGSADEDTDISEEEKETLEIVREERDKVSSIQRDYFMPFFYKRITDGTYLLDINQTELKQRREDNYKILKGEQNETLSLYDRFGGQIYYTVYTGEEIVQTSIVDRIYDMIAKNNKDASALGITDVISLISKDDAKYDNIFYDKRPELKSSQSDDPRVKAYDLITFGDSIAASVANYFNNTAKALVDFTTFFISDRFTKQVAEVLKKPFESSSWKSVKPIFNVLFIVVLLGLLVYIGKFIIKNIKHGESKLQFITNIVGVFLSFGLAIVIVADPIKVIDISSKIMTIGESLTAGALNEEYRDDEIVNSSRMDNVTTAAIWEDAIFKPWVKGMFCDVAYEDLYTTFSTKGNKWTMSEDAATNIGDISVQRDSNEENNIKNWAALAYSCSTVYHLNSVDSEKIEYEATSTNENLTAQEKDVWPKGTIVDGSICVYTDDFRWIDADLKVGQYEKEKDDTTDAYVNYREYEFKGINYSLRSVWLSILLIPLLVLGLKKTGSAVMLLVGFMRMLFRSCVNVYKPDNEQYNVLANLKVSFWDPFINLLLELILILVGIQLYKTLGVSENVGYQLVYVLMVAYLCTLKPSTIKKQTSQISKKIKSVKNSAANWRQNASNNIKGFELSVLSGGSVAGIAQDMENKEKEAEAVGEKTKEMENEGDGTGGSPQTRNGGVLIQEIEDVKNNLNEKLEVVPRGKRDEIKKGFTAFCYRLNREKSGVKKAEIINNEIDPNGPYAGLMKDFYNKLGWGKNNKMYADTSVLYDNRVDYKKQKEAEEYLSLHGNGYGNPLTAKGRDLDNKILKEKIKNSLEDKAKDGKLEQEDIKKASKDINKNRRHHKIEILSEGFKQAAGIHGTSLIPPIVKIYIFGFFVALYIIGLIIAMIAGTP